MKQQARLPLPIDPYLESLVKDGQKHSTLLVKASPGSGKTTRLPWAMAKDSADKVLVLEPRRLAAKLAALRIAEEEGFEVGSEVGYHFRFERCLSAQTRLIFYTEGTFLRTLGQDPELRGVSTVILDEFHERHIETDLALAALRALQRRRPDLKLVLMSATLDTRIFEYFEDACLFEVEAPHFEVKINYLPNQPSVLERPLEVKVKEALLKAPTDADALVFVPGMREMLRLRDYLGDQLGEVLLLHSELTKDEQELALRPLHRRKIILATNIAESSVTIPGIRVVVDSGLQREAQFSPWTGLQSLADKPITQSQAIQRAGRAGRTAPGECFRLYAQQDFNERPAHTVPEILKADLTDTYLRARALAVELDWFTAPPKERWLLARELCQRLGAVSEAGELTAIGEKLSALPLEARLARALVAAEGMKAGEKKQLLDFIAVEIEGDRSGRLRQRLGEYLRQSGTDDGPWQRALLSGFVDQVARLRPRQHDLIHFSGRTLKLHPSLKDLHHDFVLVLDITQRQEAIKVVPIEEEWLLGLEPFPFSEDEAIEVGEKIRFKSQTKLGSILIDERVDTPGWEALSGAARDKLITLSRQPLQKLWQEWKETEVYERLHFWARLKKQDLDALMPSPEAYFEQHQELNWDGLRDFFLQHVSSELELKGLDEALPLKINLGGKRELRVHYPLNLDPYVEAPMQDFYGQKTTPTILRGELALTLKLLGPHKRPLQVTRDLPGFWARTYPQLKKELARDYPRHHWPDNPAEAKPVLLKRMLNE